MHADDARRASDVIADMMMSSIINIDALGLPPWRHHQPPIRRLAATGVLHQ